MLKILTEMGEIVSELKKRQKETPSFNKRMAIKHIRLAINYIGDDYTEEVNDD